MASFLLRPVPASVLLAAVLHLVWVYLVANSGGDLAAQDAWAEFAARHPGSAYNFSWYGGIHPVSYSVISPYLMALLGVRTTMVLIGVISAGLLARIVEGCRGVRRPLLPSLWGAFALACNAGSGRVTFGLGLMFALAVVALVFTGPPIRLRMPAVVLCSALATAGSPVAGLFLGVVAAALFLQRRRRIAYAVALPFPVVIALSAWLFPFQGVQPMPWLSGLIPIGCSLAVYVLSPPQWRTVRIGAVVYAAGTLATMIVPSQVGLNVERLALIFGGTALLAAVDHNRRRRQWRTRYLAAVWLAFAGLASWQTAKPVVDVVLTTPTVAWTDADLAPLIRQLKRVDADRGRIEVVPVRSHREAAALVPYVNLARGWNRQADLDRDALFYDGTLDRRSYRAWLKHWAVRYVVLPVEDRLDTGAAEEAELISSGLPYLEQTWSDANWKMFRVKDPTPLVEPPAAVERAGADELVINVTSARDVLVRVRYSPWLGLVDAAGKGVEQTEVLDGERLRQVGPHWHPLPGQSEGIVPERSESGVPYLNRHGCLTRAGDWTRLHVPRAGTYRIAALYQVPRGTPCPE
ncbi:MFS transporter [Streptomyces sp. LN549]|uniref:MFS transporter n=1 Tax=Streptomyces sp. LN549 TaxID=3112979 RepID=UPI003711E5D4